MLKTPYQKSKKKKIYLKNQSMKFFEDPVLELFEINLLFEII